MTTLPVRVSARWRVECWRQGRLIWTEEYDNLVVTEGRDTLLTRSFKTVPADVNWFIGLKGAGTVAAGDTMASHPGWAELTPYSNATRPAYSPGTVASGAVDNNSNPASFTINASATVVGAFMTTSNVKGGTGGLLYGAGDFAQSRAVQNNDVLNVRVTLSIAAS